MREEDFFTCKACGCHKLLVKEYYKVANSITEVQYCHCGKSENGLSYQKEYVTYTPGVDYYYLSTDHRFDEEANELSEENLGVDEIDNIDITIYCKNCYYKEGKKNVMNDLLDIEVGDVEFFVVCASCGKEIEFGWSYHGREVLIWPVECADFDPRKRIPEPRYKHDWAKRGWLKPETKNIRA